MLPACCPVQGVKKANFHRVRIHVGMAREKAKDLHRSTASSAVGSSVLGPPCHSAGFEKTESPRSEGEGDRRNEGSLRVPLEEVKSSACYF